jgi:hypothetical protein
VADEFVWMQSGKITDRTSELPPDLRRGGL